MNGKMYSCVVFNPLLKIKGKNEGMVLLLFDSLLHAQEESQSICLCFILLL